MLSLIREEEVKREGMSVLIDLRASRCAPIGKFHGRSPFPSDFVAKGGDVGVDWNLLI